MTFVLKCVSKQNGLAVQWCCYLPFDSINAQMDYFYLSIITCLAHVFFKVQSSGGEIQIGGL